MKKKITTPRQNPEREKISLACKQCGQTGHGIDSDTVAIICWRCCNAFATGEKRPNTKKEI
jgi:hypothetical protein